MKVSPQARFKTTIILIGNNKAPGENSISAQEISLSAHGLVVCKLAKFPFLSFLFSFLI